MAYYKQYGTEAVIVRFFNTVATDQLSNFGMAIPNFVEKALRGEEVLVFGSGEQKRKLLHVNDAIRAVRGLMDTGKGIGRVFNVGNPFEVSMNELATRIIAKTGGNSVLEHISYQEAYGGGFEEHDASYSRYRIAQETLGSEIEYDLDRILDDVIARKRTLMHA